MLRWRRCPPRRTEVVAVLYLKMYYCSYMKYLLLFLFFGFATTTFAQSMAGDTLEWSDKRKLQWSDFKGEDIDIPGSAGQAFIEILCRIDRPNIFAKMRTVVVTVFSTKTSWAPKAAQTEQGLKFYRVFFDIYEVYARKLRQDYAHTKWESNPMPQFQEKYNATLEAANQRSKLYMKETKMSTDAEALDKWEKQIKVELEELGGFAGNR